VRVAHGLSRRRVPPIAAKGERMDAWTEPQKTVIALDVPKDDRIGPPFGGGRITVDWADRVLRHNAHYLLRDGAGAAIYRYSQSGNMMQAVAVDAEHCPPPFEIVGRIVRLVRTL